MQVVGPRFVLFLVLMSTSPAIGQLEVPTPAPGCKPLSAPQPSAVPTKITLRPYARCQFVGHSQKVNLSIHLVRIAEPNFFRDLSR